MWFPAATMALRRRFSRLQLSLLIWCDFHWSFFSGGKCNNRSKKQVEALSTTEVGTSSIVLCESLRYNVVLCCVSCSDDDADADAFASIALWAQSLCWPYRCSHNNGNAFSSHVLKRPDASKHFCSTDMNRGKDRQTDGRTSCLHTFKSPLLLHVVWILLFRFSSVFLCSTAIGQTYETKDESCTAVQFQQQDLMGTTLKWIVA